MDNLINDIRNVFNNSGSKNQPILKQGKEFISYADDYVKVVSPELKIIQQTTSPKLKSWRIKIQSTQTSSSFLKRMCSTCSESAEPPCGACGPNETSLAIASREPRGFITSERTFLTQ